MIPISIPFKIVQEIKYITDESPNKTKVTTVDPSDCLPLIFMCFIVYAQYLTRYTNQMV